MQNKNHKVILERENKMTLGIILLVIAGMGFVGLGIVTSYCAANKINMAVVQLGQTLLCLAAGLAVMFFQKSADCPLSTQLITFASLFVSGVCNFCAFELLNRAMRTGPNGIIWSLGQSALVFPFIFGVVFFGEKATLLRLLGVGAIIISIIFFGKTQKDESENREKPQSKRWLWLALGAFLADGIVQISANLPSYLATGDAINSVSRTVYLQIGALAGFGLTRLVNREKLECRGTLVPVLVLTVIYLAVFFGLVFRGLNLLAEAGAGSVGYPIMIGSCVIGFFLYSIIILKEKVTAAGLTGFLFCLAGVIALSL